MQRKSDQKALLGMSHVKSNYKMKDRIKKIMEMQRTTQQDFADQLKIAPATLSSIFTGRTRPTLAIVDAIKSRFPQISTDWLMFGKGDMLVKRDEEAEQSDGENGSENDLLIDCDSASKTEQNNADNSPVNQSIPDYATKSGDVAGFAMKSCEVKQRRITEIRVFYDDQTWETFVPSAG